MFDKVYEIVKRIPKGKVATYGQIADLATEELKNKKTKELRKSGNEERKNVSPRVVGFALHKNPDPENIPCHRVVNYQGKLAENYAFGGWEEQRRKLLKERVMFRSVKFIDKCCII